MNDNTILRIKVPAHLYESVKEQLTINEAKKSGKAFGDWKVVKEKKLPKDGMKKVEEVEKVEETEKNMEKKTRTLDELKAAKEKLSKKIEEMENADKKEPVEEAISPEIMDAISQIVDFAKDNAGYLAGIGGITGIAKMIADKIKQDPEARKALDKKTGAGSTDTSFFEENKEEVNELFGLGKSKTTFQKGDQVMDKEDQSYWYIKATNVDGDPKLYLLTAQGTRDPKRQDIKRAEMSLTKTSK